MKIGVLGLLFYFVCSFVFADQEDLVRIKGSDTMVNLEKKLSWRFMEKHPDVNIAVRGGGSDVGFAALLDERCEIVDSSRRIEQKEIFRAKEKGFEPKEYTIALDGLVIAVNINNQVSSLTVEEIKAIFTGNIANWRDVGGRDAKIRVVSRELGSGTYAFFREHILADADFSKDAIVLSSNQDIVDEIIADKDAIGYCGMGFLSNKFKAVKVAKDEQSEYVSPTKDNVKNSKYPICRPLFMYTKGEPVWHVGYFLNYIMSEEGQKVIEKAGFVPIS